MLIPREEGKQIFDNSARKKKNKSSTLHKFPTPQKSSRPMRTSQLFTQDNNTTFSQILIQRDDILKGMSNKKSITTKSVISNPLLKNPKHTAVLNDCGIDLDHPVLPVEVAARRAERIAKEKKSMTSEQQMAAAQRLRALSAAGAATQASAAQSSGVVNVQGTASSVVQPSVTHAISTVVTTVTTTVVGPPTTPTSKPPLIITMLFSGIFSTIGN